MGEVWKARDTRLERTVAIKVLPQLSASPEMRQRFEREAKTISQLSHAHICALYDVGREGETEYLVMEYLEGETLSDRLAKGALPLEQTLRFGTEIADALDKAHRQGIVHRDLKPGNVMLTKSGVKLLDFGLAKAMEAPSEPTALTSRPTVAPNLTQEGAILGTFQYMAPEQLEGKEADARTDIFAFGCVLYEMATGRNAFSGSSRASLTSAIMSADPPPISSIQPASPPALDRTIRRCLAKDPERRWQNARDVGLELEEVPAGGGVSGAAPVAPRSRTLDRLGWVLAALLLVGAPILLLSRGTSGKDMGGAVRFFVSPPPNAGFTRDVIAHNMAVSPNGRHIVFVASSEGRRMLWLRDIDSLVARPLEGTEDSASPFWSPDGRFIGFFSISGKKLKKIAVSGGPAETICDAGKGSASWAADGTILFAQTEDRSRILRVSSSGGAVTPVTALERGDFWHYWPSFLPGGRRFLYTSWSAEGTGSVRIGSLDSGKSQEVLRALSRAVFSPDGYLLYVRDGSLFAQAFDPKSLRLSGEAFSIADPVPYFSLTGSAVFSVSPTGVLVFQAGEEQSRPSWFDRNGREGGVVGSPRNIETFTFSLSPDGRKVAAGELDRHSGTSDLWIYELGRDAPTRFTFHPGGEFHPVWSPDGRRIVFSFDPATGGVKLNEKALDESGNGKTLGLAGRFQIAHSWSDDGRYLLYTTFDPATQNDLWVLPMLGERKPVPFQQSEFDEPDGRFSPDARWIAFVSNESGRPEVYAAPFPGPGEKRRISIDGGSQPRWRRDGKEIFYISADNRIMAVSVRADGSFDSDTPVALFHLAPISDRLETALWDDYEVAPDGQRFLVNVGLIRAQTMPLTVVLNWTADLKKPR